MLQVLPINTISADDAIKSLIDREGGDHARFMRYKGVVRDVYDDMNLSAMRHTKRRLIEVDSRTNSIKVPPDYFHFASISAPDACGKYEPMIINTNIQEDLVDIDSEKTCDCGSKLCGLIKNYEAIVAEVDEEMPDTSVKTFTAITRKLLKEGKLLTERTFPVRIYTDGVWTDVQLKTETEELCSLEVDQQGCVLDTEANWTACDGCASAQSFEQECGGLFCPAPAANTYNATEQGDRIYFPSNFMQDHVLLRYYATEKPKDIRIPRISKEAFIAGLKHFVTMYDDKSPLWQKTLFERNYNKAKDLLNMRLNRYSIKEYYSILTPKRTMP